MTGIDLLLARTEVATKLAEHFVFGDIQDVEILPRTSGVAAAYKGPRMVELWLERKIDFNPGLSTLSFREGCDRCGRSSYKILGVEEEPKEVKVGDRWELMPRIARSPGQGVILRRSDLGPYDLFEYGNGFRMCTERVKNYITEEEWTNVEFWEYGEVVEE